MESETQALFDLDFLGEYCVEQGLPFRADGADAVVVSVAPDLSLCFRNLPEERDTIVYFEESRGGWHTHAVVNVDRPSEIGVYPVSVLQGLFGGRLVVVKIVSPSGVLDIYYEQGSAPFETKYMEPGERTTLIKLAPSSATLAGGRGPTQ